MDANPAKAKQSDKSLNYSRDTSSSNKSKISLIEDLTESVQKGAQYQTSNFQTIPYHDRLSPKHESPLAQKKIQEYLATGKEIDKYQIMQALLNEENVLYKYATESPFVLQKNENAKSKSESPPLSSRSKITDYQQLLRFSKIDKPRLLMFARQLQLSFILARALIRVLPPSLIQKFLIKLKHLCTNIH